MRLRTARIATQPQAPVRRSIPIHGRWLPSSSTYEMLASASSMKPEHPYPLQHWPRGATFRRRKSGADYTGSHHARAGYLIPWFSIMLPNVVDHLRLVPEELSIKFPPVRRDEHYPAQLVGDGRWLVVDGNEPPGAPCLVQFDVWAGMRPQWTEDAWNYLPIPHLLGIGDDEGSDIRHRSIGVRVSDDCGVVVIMSWVPGQLDRPGILRPSSFDPGDTSPLRMPSC